MTRILLASILCVAFLTVGCQKCQQCSYTYTKIEIISTENGEEEQQTTVSGNLEDGDFDTSTEQECIKRGEEFTLEAKYQLEQSTTDKIDFEYTCTEN